MLGAPKRLILFAATIAMAVIPAALANDCKLVAVPAGYKAGTDRYGSASKKVAAPLWAQELIGADLVRQEMKDQDPAESPAIAAIDDGMDAKKIPPSRLSSHLNKTPSAKGHGTSVACLMLCDSPVGVSATGSMVHVASVTAAQDFIQDQEKFRKFVDCVYPEEPINEEDPYALKRIHSKFHREILTIALMINLGEDFDLLRGKKPKLVNFSQEIPSADFLPGVSDMYMRNFRQLGASGALIIAGAGNSGRILRENDPLQTAPVIVVGSLSPVGDLSKHSNRGKPVTILAPGEDVLIEDGDKKGVFTGTSFATPLVTGALANAVAYLPNLNREQATQLLEKTALPTFNSRAVERLDGAGTLNAYKVYRVAKRLNESGKSTDALGQEASFDFQSEAEKRWQEASRLLASDSCDSRREGFGELRKSFLLNPTARAAEALQKVYAEEGYDLTAKLYSTLR